MGGNIASSFLNNYPISNDEQILTLVNRNRFDFLHIIGRGGFGKVWRVRDRKFKIEFALKEIQKVKVIDKKSEHSLKSERDFLKKLKHPFIANMYCAFQDFDNLYIVMDLFTGGDLRYHISRKKTFTEHQTKFFILCILIALEYIHSSNVIHRDIKPENLVLDNKGYLHITDFGIAKKCTNANTETSGTPGYMSPEVMRGHNHGYPSDFYAIGVIGYEFMIGRRPYLGKSRKEIKEQIIAKQVQIFRDEIPFGWSDESGEFINKMIQRKPENRLGYKGINEIFEHNWFKGIILDDIKNKKMLAPYIPDNEDNYDKRYCEGVDKIGVDTQKRYMSIIKKEEYNSVFNNFTYWAFDKGKIENEEDGKDNDMKRKKGLNLNFKDISIQTSKKIKIISIKTRSDFNKVPPKEKFTINKLKERISTISGLKISFVSQQKKGRTKNENFPNQTQTRFRSKPKPSNISTSDSSSYNKSTNCSIRTKTKNVYHNNTLNKQKGIFDMGKIPFYTVCNVKVVKIEERNSFHKKSSSSKIPKLDNC